jgi:hypothetical protein
MSEQQARFWSRVLAAADAVESGELDADAFLGLLLGLEEGFADLQDPVESFEAYTVLRLCRSTRIVLERARSV